LGAAGGGLVLLVIAFVVVLVIADRKLNPSVRTAPLPAIERAEPTGSVPANEMLFDADGSGSFQIYVANGAGPAHQLTNDPTTDAWWPRPSPDRTRILFYRTPAGTHDKDFKQTSLWVMNADGSSPTELLPPGSHGWNQHGHAEWSPDGQHLVMFGGKTTNPQIWVTDALGRQPRRLTDDGGVNLDPSWSPDGRTVVYVGCPHSLCTPGQQEVYTVPSSGGPRTRLTDDGVRDHDPYFSPDGSEIAFLSQTARPSGEQVVGSWNIRAVSASGGAARDVTTGADVTSLPRWSKDGRLFTHRLIYGRPGFDLWVFEPRTGQGHPVREESFNEEYPSP
jgi:TolB protein